MPEPDAGIATWSALVPSIEEAVCRVTADGIPLLQSGSGYGAEGDGGFAYFDTLDRVGLIVEAIEVPRRRKPSEPIPAVAR